MRRLHLLVFGITCMLALVLAVDSMGSSDPFDQGAYLEPFAPDADYDSSLPSLEELLGDLPGSRPATPAEILHCFETIADASPRVVFETAGHSHEGRQLFRAIVSIPANLARLDEIESGMQSLAMPTTGGSDAGAERLPAAIWIGAAVHGGEPSGADAALALLYHLAADRSDATERILDSALIIINPLQNPDGRMRHLARLDQWSSRVPVVDDQSVQHRGGWPTARGNHYLLDLNRDWFALTQPETRSRLDVLHRFRPQVMIDLHEMRSFDSYLFSPPREPYNPNLPETTHKWWHRFSTVQAREFGQMGWSCYTGDWNEEFNPNRGGSWPLFTGAVAILEEQAGTDGASIKLPDGSVVRYREAVHHQFVATLAIVEVAAAGRAELLKDYADSRRASLKSDKGEPKAYIISASGRPEAARRLAQKLSMQGVSVIESSESFRSPEATDYWGEKRGSKPFPAGSYLVPLDHPEGRLARAILDFDPEIKPHIASGERRARETGQSSLFYEATAWSLAMAEGAEVYQSRSTVRVRGETVTQDLPAGEVVNPEAPYGFVLDAIADGAANAVAELHSSGIKVWAGEAPFRIGEQQFSTGSIVVRRAGNVVDLDEKLNGIAGRTGVRFHGVDHALTDVGPDLGSRRFRFLQSPRTAILIGPPFYQTTVGALWFLMDHELGMKCTLLSLGTLATSDLDKYSVILVPDAAPGKGVAALTTAGEEGLAALDQWVNRGGTLITLGEGNWILFGREEPFGTLRARRQVLDQVSTYRPTLPSRAEETRSRPISPERDEWLRKFSPSGVILRADLNAKHWLSGGVGDRVPVLVKTDLALETKPPAEIVGRFALSENLRVSGLVWPEARERWAETSYLSREKIGRGQIISFLGNPFYRGYFHGTGRLLKNAILLGPGMGTAARTEW